MNLAQSLRNAASVPDATDFNLTFAELVESYTTANPDKLLGPRLKKWVQAFGDLGAWDLTASQVSKAANELIRQGYKPGTVNREVSSLGMVYLWAKKRHITPPGFTAPSKGVPRQAEDIRRVYVTDEEMAKLRLLARTAFKDKRFGLYINMLADSGARKGELLPRRWNELDLEGRKLVLATSKNGAPRTLFFSPETMALAKRLKPKNDSGLIFPSTRVLNQPMNFRAMWNQLTAMVGIPTLHIHDLRHVVAASLLGSGVSIAVTAAVLGHKSHVMTTARYGHLSQELVGAVMADRFSVAHGAGAS